MSKKDFWDKSLVIATIFGAIFAFISAFGTLWIAFNQFPLLRQQLQNITKSYDVTLSESLKIHEKITACLTRAKTPHITECSTCHEYPIEEINATLRICDITSTNSITNTTNRTEELKIIR